MFDWVPLSSYTAWYFHIILIVTVVTFSYSQSIGLRDLGRINYLRTLGFLLFAFVLLYIGTRPVSGRFGDMSTYNRKFMEYFEGKSVTTNKDVLFHQFMKFCSSIMNNRTFFFVCALFYTLPAYLISKKWFKQYWVYSFLLLVGSFSFFAYGTNGIRNGIASSFFLMAISREKKIPQIIWLFLAVNFHSSMYLPTVAFIATWFFNVPRYYFYFWIACIPLSLLGGSFWEGLFAGVIADDRASYLTDGNVNKDNFSSTGFRWDFLLYSATGVFAGWYYIFKKKLDDKVYFKLFNMYLAVNGFWILVIRANFSNRFAYLSWFMLALVICYPWLKYSFEEKQHKKLGYVTMAYIGFTYLMNVFVYGL